MSHYQTVTKATLAQAYNVCPRTVSNWIKKLLPTLPQPERDTMQAATARGLLKPAQVKILVEKWGQPNNDKLLTP